ncbi:MAG: hypothetical protein RL375_3369 [Pseudomonadota bacterium]
MNDADLIDSLGGPAKVCELLGIPKSGGVQRVQNWKVRGIPARVRLQWPQLFPMQLMSAQAPYAECQQQEAAHASI